MRLFFAAFLSHENSAGYQALIDRVMSDEPGVLRPIPPRSHHLTLAFLGEIPEADVENCRAGLSAMGELETFSFSLGPPRILVGRGRPRLIHVDVAVGIKHVSEAQAALVAHLSRSLSSLKIRPKPPHITLARFKKNARRSQAARIEEALASHYDTSLAWEDRCTKIHLVRSTLTPSGPVYESLGEVRLSSVD